MEDDFSLRGNSDLWFLVEFFRFASAPMNSTMARRTAQPGTPCLFANIYIQVHGSQQDTVMPPFCWRKFPMACNNTPNKKLRSDGRPPAKLRTVAVPHSGCGAFGGNSRHKKNINQLFVGSKHLRWLSKDLPIRVCHDHTGPYIWPYNKLKLGLHGLHITRCKQPRHNRHKFGF